MHIKGYCSAKLDDEGFDDDDDCIAIKILIMTWVTCRRDTVQASWRQRRLFCRSAQSRGYEATKTRNLIIIRL